MTKFVPVVLYRGGERFVVGQAEIHEDGSIRGSITDKPLAEEIAHRLPWEVTVSPLPEIVRPVTKRRRGS